ncbi:GGDEF domain-containing protein [Deinococcus sp.]|uniref:GGDEF domain-containing protein n=1 Tax=Deinococcus sp. TaxID=47478 RepID=UPI003CC507C2
MPDHNRRPSDPLTASLRPGAGRVWSGATSDALRRRVYLWAIVLGSGVLIVVWTMQLRRPAPDYYVLVGHPLLLLQCIWAAAWLLRGRALIVAERVVFVVNALAILVQMLMALIADQRQLLSLTSAAYWMLVALSILSFLIFSNKQALLFSAGFYGVSVALPWSALLARGSSLSTFSELARVQLTSGVVLVLLSILAWYRESFTVERGQRLSLEHLANTDPMTQVPNRRALYREIEHLLEGARTGGDGCLILLDIDHFKRINDTFGHNVGDEVLIWLASMIQDDLRETDAIGRWGGEEFLMTLPGLSAELGGQVAERLRLRLEQQAFGYGQQVTASFGVTCCTADDDLQSCTARADRALYAAKTAGRNRVAILPAAAAAFKDEEPARSAALLIVSEAKP